MKAEYTTRQRNQILDFLKEAGSHVTAGDIITHLKEQGAKVSTATVYRTLDRLCASGFVKKFVIDERSGACYQYAENAECDAHFHLKCIKCGLLIHLSCEFLNEMNAHILDDHGFTVSSGKTVIYGTCAQCSGKAEPKSACSHSHHSHIEKNTQE
ncbi:MAG: transcriptional repressor [Clostridia bacterium]|nr:transcriptional repressor [Clostridia bacterium]